jgi:sulfur-oxidizing protein SoxY
MDQQRREAMRFALVFGLMAAAGLIAPAQAEEWTREAFAEKSLDATFRLLGTQIAESSGLLTFTAPEIAENGAVVPLVVSTPLKAEQIAIVVEKNPNPLAAHFFFSGQADPYLATRIKMAETSRVFALVRVESKWFMASKEIKVTLGGCGG